MEEKYIRFLSAIFLFDNINFYLINDEFSFCERCVLKEFEENETVFSSVENADSIAVVASGKVRIVTGLKDKEVLLKYACTGESFGAASLFNDISHNTTGITCCTSEIIFIPEKLVTEMIMINPQIGLNYLKFLSDRVSFLNRKIAVYSAGSAEDKLAVYLLSNASDNIIEVKSMSWLASQLGISRASLYRAVENLSSAGLIKYDGRSFKIIDRTRIDNLIK